MARGKRHHRNERYTIWYEDGEVAADIYTRRPGVAINAAKGISRARKRSDVIIAQTSDVGYGRIAYDEVLIFRNGRYLGRRREY